MVWSIFKAGYKKVRSPLADLFMARPKTYEDKPTSCLLHFFPLHSFCILSDNWSFGIEFDVMTMKILADVDMCCPTPSSRFLPMGDYSDQQDNHIDKKSGCAFPV